MDDTLGQYLPDRYSLEECLGQGGMGSVYRARDAYLAIDVAIKIVRLHDLEPESIARFQREAKLSSRLSHPNIVTILDFGVLETRFPYMVLEYIPGENLENILESQGPIEVEHALEIMRQVAAALAHAHKEGVLHRDLKPANILVFEDERGIAQVKLLDFGIARSLGDDSSVEVQNSTLTRPGMIVGSPLYMSPEQVRADKQIDQRSDIYSFGSVLFKMLTGKAPFLGDSALETMSLKLEQKAPSLAETGMPGREDLEAFLRRCLDSDPDGRFATMVELETALGLLLEHEQEQDLEGASLIEPPGSASFSHYSRASKSFPVPLVIVLCLGVVLFGACFLGYLALFDGKSKLLSGGLKREAHQNQSAGQDSLDSKALNSYANSSSAIPADFSADVPADVPADVSPIPSDISISGGTDFGLGPINSYAGYDQKNLLDYNPKRRTWIVRAEATSSDFKQIASRKNISSLTFLIPRGNPVDYKLLRGMKLQRLELHALRKIDSELVAALSTLETVEELHFKTCTFVGVDVLEPLKKMPRLRRLSLEKSSLEEKTRSPEDHKLKPFPAAVLNIVSHLLELKDLVLSGSDVERGFLKGLPVGSQFRQLQLGELHFDEEQLKPLLTIKVQHLSIKGNSFSRRFVQRIIEKTGLETINLTPVFELDGEASLTRQDVQALSRKNPGITFHYFHTNYRDGAIVQ